MLDIEHRRLEAGRATSAWNHKDVTIVLKRSLLFYLGIKLPTNVLPYGDTTYQLPLRIRSMLVGVNPPNRLCIRPEEA